MRDRQTIALFGGSGATGQQVVTAAGARGVRIQGLVRTAGSLGQPAAALAETVGALTDPAALERTLAGADAAIVVFGPRPPYREVFCAAAMAAIIAAMQRAGCRRLVCQTGAMVGDHRQNLGPGMRLLRRLFLRARPEVARDSAAEERLVMDSGLDWTLVKPPRLTRAAPRGRLRTGSDLRVGWFASVARADLAALLLDEALGPGHPRQVLFVAG